MSEVIITAFITGGLALLGTLVSVKAGNEKIMAELDKHNAVQDEKIENLTREVRKHNEFATRVPILETKVEMLEKQKALKS